MSSILLHPKLGVNPRLTTCERCGKDGRDLLLLGTSNWFWECVNCKQKILSTKGKQPKECPQCHFHNIKLLRELEPSERIVSGLCEACEKELEEHADIVSKGGVYFQCSDCHATGVIKPDTPLAGLVRRKSGIEPPKPVGISFTKEDCPRCGPNKVEDEAPPPA